MVLRASPKLQCLHSCILRSKTKRKQQRATGVGEEEHREGGEEVCVGGGSVRGWGGCVCMEGGHCRRKDDIQTTIPVCITPHLAATGGISS